MTEGSIFEFYLPPEMAFGLEGSGREIPPKCPVIYKIKLLRIEADDVFEKSKD